jgi:hypothetical protein
MKLRIRGNAIRIRVTRGELETIATDGRLVAETHFGSGRTLRYGLEVREDVDGLHSTFDGRSLIVTLPARDAAEWTATDLVTLAGEQALPGEASLKIVVEKDFACLTPREGDDDEDTFAHPLTDTGAGC